jgi:fatty acid desaturase
MATSALCPQPVRSLGDTELRKQLQKLRKTDNYTNLYYLVRTYLFLGLVMGGTIWFYHIQSCTGLSFWWNVPVTLVAMILVGAGQHQLTGLAHEAAHHTLFKNRSWNELASDWLCMFPLFSTTHQYRLQHLAHHQFVNDPVRDPDVAQLQASGHWLAFPLSRKAVGRALARELWPHKLFRFMRVRARYSLLPTEKNPYIRKDWQPPRLGSRVGLAYVFGLAGLLTGLYYSGNLLLLAGAPAVCWAVVLTFYALLPSRMYNRTRIHPVFPLRAVTMMRLTFATAVLCTLAWLPVLTGAPAALYYLLLWFVPIFTSFAFFMILRQLVQHGNGGRGWLTNTRIFFVHRFINFCVFPIGQDYHLPHHLYATVPHYRLKHLHNLLLDYPEYRDQAVIVEGYFRPLHHPQTRPTVLDVLGPGYTPHTPNDVYIDHTVLDQEVVEDKAAILGEGEAEVQRLRAASP